MNKKNKYENQPELRDFVDNLGVLGCFCGGPKEVFGFSVCLARSSNICSDDRKIVSQVGRQTFLRSSKVVTDRVT
jgi:hypothetical protein